VNTPTLAVSYGANTFTCALTIKTSDTNVTDPYLRLDDYAANTTNVFPNYKSPTVSDLSWSVPGLSIAKTALYNGGLPGQTVWAPTTKNTTTTQCITIFIQVPTGVAAGTYSAPIEYLALISPTGSDAAIAQEQLVTFSVVVP
jgi:hypothetical protein